MASPSGGADPHHGHHHHHHHHHRHRHPVQIGVVRPVAPGVSLLALSLAARLSLVGGLLVLVWALLLGAMQ